MSARLNDPELITDDDFRLMTENDLDGIIEIEESIYPYPWTRGIFHDCLRVGYCCWVLKLEERIVAYSVISAAAEESHLLTIVVRKNEQGKGYGKKMLNKMISVALTQDVKIMYLEVRPSNKTAINLYYERGFNEAGVRSNYYPAENGREDALIMAMELMPESEISE